MTERGTASGSSITETWERLKTSIDMDELRSFAAQFSGSPEAAEASERIAQLNEYMRCWNLLMKIAPRIQPDQMEFAREALLGLRLFLQRWPGTTHDSHIRELIADVEPRLRDAEAREAERRTRDAQFEKERDLANRRRATLFALRDIAAIPTALTVAIPILLLFDSHALGFNGEILPNLNKLVAAIVKDQILVLLIAWFAIAAYMRTWNSALALLCYMAISIAGAYVVITNWHIFTALFPR